MPLSDTAIKNAKANTDKDYKLYDEKGMYVLIHKNGSKYFRLKFCFEGKEKVLSLGTYPETSLKEAREIRARPIPLDWSKTDCRTKSAWIVPLSRQAVEILANLKSLTGEGRFVFPSARTPNGSRAMSDAALLAALRQMGFSKEEMTVHGFRAMVRTILEEVLKFEYWLIEHQLRHSVRDQNGRAYNRTLHLAERHKMMQAWADYLDNLKADVMNVGA